MGSLGASPPQCVPAEFSGEEALRHSHCPFSVLGTMHISPCMPTHEWQTAISCNGTKLIARIDSGDFQISLIYQLLAFTAYAIKISSRGDGQVETEIAFEYIDSK